jgi:hypothetical protein
LTWTTSGPVGLAGKAERAGLIGDALDTLLYRHLQIIGTVMKSRTQEEKRAMVRRFGDRWLDHFADGRLIPVFGSDSPYAKLPSISTHGVGAQRRKDRPDEPLVGCECY